MGVENHLWQTMFNLEKVDMYIVSHAFMCMYIHTWAAYTKSCLSFIQMCFNYKKMFAFVCVLQCFFMDSGTSKTDKCTTYQGNFT